MSQARDFADSFSAVSTGRRNYIINGDFSVAQRSTSEVTGAGYTTVDRWRYPNTSQKSQQVTNDRDLSIPKMLKVTSASTGYGIVEQRIEDVTRFSGQTLTVSFWAKTSDYSDMRFYMYQDFGTSGSADVSVIDDADYFTVPDSGWNKYTVTVSSPSVSGKTINAGNYLYFGFGPNSGTDSGVVYYSEVQLELGNSASPFEHRSYGEELRLCQRYFYAEDQSDTYHAVTNGFYSSTTNFISLKHLPVPMRVGPSISTTGTWQTAGTNGIDCSNIIVVDSTGTDIQTVQVRATVSGVTAGQGANLRNKNDATATFHLSAEL